MIQPDQRGWRTLVRVTDIDHDRCCFYVVVPAWSARRKIRIDDNGVPASVRALVEPGHRFHATVNTGAERARDLSFAEWETT